MTMTRPWRRMTWHLSQIGLTLGLTFTALISSVGSMSRPGLLVAINDSPTGQVVRRELDHDPVLGKDADVVLTHLAADVGQHP